MNKLTTQLLTTKEAQKFVGCGRYQFAVHIEPKVPVIRIGRQKFYKPIDLQGAIDKLRVPDGRHVDRR